MKNLFRPLVLSAAALSFLASCSDDNNTAPAPTGGAGQYAFVINEGNFTNGTGSVSRFDKNTKTVTTDAFGSANKGAVLGSVAQSMGVIGNTGYVVVNNSNKIEVVSLPDFKSKATISGLNQPRYFLPSTTNTLKAYVTEWLGGPYPAPYTAGRVSTIDLATNKVASSVPVGTNPERLAATAGNIYVTNSGSPFLTVINDASGAVTGTIALPSAASSLVVDKDGALWILCSSPATLVKFIPATSSQQLFPFAAGGYASGLRIGANGQQLYYSYKGAEYRMNTTDTVLPSTPLIRRSFYGFDIDPTNGQLYGTDALNYASPGRLIRYQPDGTKLDSATVQVSPNGVVFY
jgi:YVTN family beta-propeller protein